MYEYILRCEDCSTELGMLKSQHERSPQELSKSGMICESCAQIRQAVSDQEAIDATKREEALQDLIDTQLAQDTAKEEVTPAAEDTDA